RIMRGGGKLCQQRLRLLSGDNRVLKEAASITIHPGIRKLRHTHMAHRIKYILRSGRTRIEAGQIAVGQDRLPGFRQTKTDGDNGITILILMFERTVTIPKAALFSAKT